MPLPFLIPWAAATIGGGAGIWGAQRNKPYGVTQQDWDDFQRAQQGGYAYGYNRWIREGKPKSAQVTMSKEEALARQSERKAEAKEKEQKETTEKVVKKAEEKEEWERRTWLQDFAERQRQFNEQQKVRELESGVKTYAKYGINPYDNPATPEEEGRWNKYTGQFEPPIDWISPQEQRATALKKEEMSRERENQEALISWYRENALMQQQEQSRQYAAQRFAQPMSWLEKASYFGETPLVQPWMLPLMSGQYNIGQAIPNWQGQSMSALPELRNPSMQYWGRMGPTAQQQYLGYQQGRTGIRPEESMFRQRATAPPSGAYSGLRWMR